MIALGNLFQDGLGVERDLDEAADWYRKAVEAGDVPAIYQLASFHILHSDWRGRDLDEAARLLLRAAEAGNADAQFQLGVAYGTRDDDSTSGADRDDLSRSRIRRSRTLYRSMGFAYDPTIAVMWMERAASQGLTDAMVNLGFRYQSGVAVSADRVAALEWFSRAAEAGSRTGQREAGLLHASKPDLSADFREAARLFQLSADAGDALAMRYLARLYDAGVGVERDLFKAAELEQTADELVVEKEERRRQKRMAKSGLRLVR